MQARGSPRVTELGRRPRPPRPGRSAQDISSGDRRPLVVDLDGTLCTSDTLVESVLALVTRQPLHLVTMIGDVGDRQRFKQKAADAFRPDPSMLPYDRTLLDYLQSQRQDGRQLVLATAADQRIALVESQRGGPHEEHVDRLLSELRNARDSLLEPQLKSSYDTALEAQTIPMALPVAASPVAPVASPLLLTPRIAQSQQTNYVSFRVFNLCQKNEKK